MSSISFHTIPVRLARPHKSTGNRDGSQLHHVSPFGLYLIQFCVPSTMCTVYRRGGYDIRQLFNVIEDSSDGLGDELEQGL
jgi:hypothetical protein